MARIPWRSALIVALVTEQAVLAAAVAATPGSLGIPPLAVAWMAILNVGVGVLLNQLRSLGSAASSPLPSRPAEPRGPEPLHRPPEAPRSEPLTAA